MYEDIVYFNEESFALGFDKIYIKPNLVITKGGDDKLNRKILEDKKTNILLDPEPTGKDKMHHRVSGLNQVLCKIAHDNEIAIGFSFKRILESKNRGKLLGKIMQNIRLCRKYKVRIVFASFAEEKYQMRGAEDLIGLLECLGMNSVEAKQSLGNVSKILEEKERTLKKGTKLAK